MKETKRIVIIILMIWLGLNTTFMLFSSFIYHDDFNKNKRGGCDFSKPQSIAGYIGFTIVAVGFKAGCEIAKPRFNLTENKQ